MLWTVPVPGFEHVRQIHAVEMLMHQPGPTAYIARDRQQQDWLFLSSERYTLQDSQEERWLAVPITNDQRRELMTSTTVSYQRICEDSPGPFRMISIYTRKGRHPELGNDMPLTRTEVPEHWWPIDHAQIKVRSSVQQP